MPRDEPGDEGTSGPPPHPLDRPWVHPTEMFARARAGQAEAARPGRRPGRELAIALGAGVAGALVTVAVLVAVGAFHSAPSTVAVASTTAAAVDDGAHLAAVAAPSVVAVVASSATATRRASGVGMDAGHVLTTSSAVGDATAVTVVDPDGTSHPARVLGRDDMTGLVLLRTSGGRIRTAPLAGDRPIRVGEWVVAVGRGDAPGPWAATGVVASLGGWAQDGAGAKRAGLISTSMQIPRAAEGGALLDRTGHVVGILAGAPAGGTLATPIGMARAVAVQLAQSGRASHGALGVLAVDAEQAHGAEVTEVIAGSAAAGAGVRTGDLIVALEGVPVGDSAALVAEVHRHKPGDVVDLRVQRGGKHLTLRVTLDGAVSTPTDTSGAETTAADPRLAGG